MNARDPVLGMITCPHCSRDFELSSAMHQHLERQLRSEIQAEYGRDLKAKLLAAELVQKAELEASNRELTTARERARQVERREAELLRRQDELEDQAAREQLARARDLAEARARVRAEAEKAADERAEQTIKSRVENYERQLSEARTISARVAQHEAVLLRQSRELADRRDMLELDLERRLADETVRIRDEVTLAAKERAALEKKEMAATSQAELERTQKQLAELRANEAAVAERARYLDERAEQDQRALVEEKSRLRAEAEKAANARAEQAIKAQGLHAAGQVAEARSIAAKAAEHQAVLLRQERELAERSERAELDLERRLAEERTRIRLEVTRMAEERAAREAQEKIVGFQAELEHARQALATARKQEADVERRARELDEIESRRLLEFEHRVALQVRENRDSLAAVQRQQLVQVEETARLKDAEHQEKLASLVKKIKELEARATQGSQQTQGEAQELVTRELLIEAFRYDDIRDVPQGTLGADLVHEVRDERAQRCGTILWEIKRTKNWSDQWLEKLRDDQRAAGAAVAVIVSHALPFGVELFCERNGIWICAPTCAVVLAGVLRSGLIQVARVRSSVDQRGDKMELLYNYLTGHEFRNHIGGVVEAYQEMISDLASEKAAMKRLWRKREKQLLRASGSMSAFYGDLQGVAGSQMGELSELALGSDSDQSEAMLQNPGPCNEGLIEPQLLRLLDELIPAEGSSVGNMTLRTRFIEEAAIRLGRELDDSVYWRYRNCLLQDGVIRLGQGRGGSVARVMSLRTA